MIYNKDIVKITTTTKNENKHKIIRIVVRIGNSEHMSVQYNDPSEKQNP
jgi:hypothetical protein